MGLFKSFTNKFTAPKASLQLNLDKFSAELGENLKGSLVVSSGEEFDVTEVRCEVQCVEQARVVRQVYDPNLKRLVPKEMMDSAVLFSAKPILSGPSRMSNGETKNFPVTINIPAGGRPTYQGMDRKVTWSVKAVAAVNGRPDATSRTAEIQVIPAAAQPIIREKEIVREVVQIPCKYCNGLMDQTLTTCPHCGASKTA
jgi:hypothetical protein